MRRLLAICSAVGLLCGALGCHCCNHVHGRCDCDKGPGYGCFMDGCGPGCGGGYDHALAPIPAGHPPEGIKDMPREAK